MREPLDGCVSAPRRGARYGGLHHRRSAHAVDGGAQRPAAATLEPRPPPHAKSGSSPPPRSARWPVHHPVRAPSASTCAGLEPDVPVVETSSRPSIPSAKRGRADRDGRPGPRRGSRSGRGLGALHGLSLAGPGDRPAPDRGATVTATVVRDMLRPGRPRPDHRAVRERHGRQDQGRLEGLPRPVGLRGRSGGGDARCPRPLPRLGRVSTGPGAGRPVDAQGAGRRAWPRSGPTPRPATLSRLRQMLLKAHDEVRRAPTP
ncbi:hypothetical protein ACRAWD_24290 [Caulobacter segnis]